MTFHMTMTNHIVILWQGSALFYFCTSKQTFTFCLISKITDIVTQEQLTGSWHTSTECHLWNAHLWNVLAMNIDNIWQWHLKTKSTKIKALISLSQHSDTQAFLCLILMTELEWLLLITSENVTTYIAILSFLYCFSYTKVAEKAIMCHSLLFCI